MKDKYGTEVLGVTFTDRGIEIHITRTEAYHITEGNEMTFLCDEMEYKDLMGSTPPWKIKKEETFRFKGMDERDVFLQRENGRITKMYKEDMELLLKENCWNIQGI